MTRQALSAKVSFNPERVHALIEANLHSAKAYLAVAEAIHDTQQRAKLRSWARERTQQANQLSSMLAELGVTNAGLSELLKTVSEATARVQTGLATGDFESVFEGALSSEESLEKMYEHLLSDPSYLPLNHSLRQHYAQVRAVRFDVARLSK